MGTGIPPVIPSRAGQPMTVPPKLPGAESRTPTTPPRLPPPVPPFSATSRATPAKTQAALPIDPKQKIRRTLAVIVGAIVLVTACAFGYEKYCTPRHSMLQLALAIDRRDRETIENYVDAPALAESFHRFAIESYKRETAATSTNFFDHLLQPLFSEIADGIAGATCTPESVINMLCGQSPTDAMKEGMANAADHTVDTFTKDGTPKTKVYGAATKALIRCATGYAVDEATAESKGQQTEMNPADYEITTQYESINRYLIIATPRNSDRPAIGYAFKRHGFGTWKWSELRSIPQNKKQTLAAH